MICIIPARKNSKGLRDKNVKKLNGIPLIKRTVDIAKKSKNIKKIYISTDDQRIIKIFKKDKLVDIPFKRPKFLSTDTSESIDVYLHMINFLEKKMIIKEFCVLLPTCPIRDVKQIDKAINIFKKKKINFLISVVKSKPLEFHFQINKKKFMKKTSRIKTTAKNRQKLTEIFAPNGSIYIFNTKQFKKEKTFMNNKTYCFEMNKYYSQDIDDKIDFNIVKKLIK